MPDLPNFEDPSQWEKIPDVAVFDEHDDKDQKGNVIRRFDRKRLEEIVVRSNKRDQTGNLCPLTLGHTDPEKPETEQPPIVGYARQFKTAWDERLGKWVIRCSYYLKKDRAAEAKEYPRTSVEVWLKDNYLDPIALSKRTPERDVGQWTYGKQTEVVRYSKSGKEKVVRYTMDETTSAPDSADGDPQGTPNPDLMKYCKSCAKKYAKRYAKRYLARYQAGAGGMASGSDTFVPGAGDDDKPNPDSTQDAPKSEAEIDDDPDEEEESGKMGKKQEEVLRMAKEQFQTELAQFQKKLEEKDARIAALEQQSSDAIAERIVTQLQSENFRIPDRAKMVAKFSKLDAAGRQELQDEIRANYQKLPPNEMIRVAPGTAESGDDCTPLQMQKAVQISSKSGGKVSFDEALKQVRGVAAG